MNHLNFRIWVKKISGPDKTFGTMLRGTADLIGVKGLFTMMVVKNMRRSSLMNSTISSTFQTKANKLQEMTRKEQITRLNLKWISSTLSMDAKPKFT